MNLRGEKTTLLTSAQGLHVGDPFIITGSSTQLWVGGDHGIQSFHNGQFQTLEPSDGSMFTDIKGIICDDPSGLWFGERRGIVHVSSEETARFLSEPTHKVAYRVFDIVDGLSSPVQASLTGLSAARDVEGNLWFATTGGLAWIDPKHIPFNSVPPVVSIISPVVINGKATAARGANGVSLPAHTTELQIDYTAASLTVPERVRFHYRLEGLDKEWQDAGTRRAAYYTNLGPGRYTFHVVAQNEDGIQSQREATMPLVILPAFYQTWWFRTLYGLVGISVVWVFYTYRIAAATAQVSRRLTAQVEERERIARDLHDTLLQGFQGLMLRFQAVLKTLPAEDRSHQMLESALERADQVLLEGRNSVRDLRGEEDAVEPLHVQLERSARELSDSSPIKLSFLVSGTPRALRPDTAREIHRVGKEAIINVCQHAKASTVWVEVAYEGSGLTMTVRDDGVGIESAILHGGRSGHWGLSGMRERGHAIGAPVFISSTLGVGTELKMRVPAKVAYVPATKGAPSGNSTH